MYHWKKKMKRNNLWKIVSAGVVFLSLSIGFGGTVTKAASMDDVNHVDSKKVYDEKNSLIISKSSKIKDFSVTVENADPKRTDYKAGEVAGSGDTLHPNFDLKNYGGVRLDFGNESKTTLSEKTTITVKQKNVGTFKGKAIDLKQRFSNFEKKKDATIYPHTFNYGYVFQISESPFSGYRFFGIGNFDYEVEFTYSDTGSIINFDEGDSFLSFNSLNGDSDSKGLYKTEYVSYKNTDNPKNVYVTNDTNIGYFNPSKSVIAEVNDATVNGDMYGGITNDFTDFLGGATFARNTVQFKLVGTTQSFKVGSATGEAWNAQSTATIFNVKMPTPTKTEEDASGNDLNNKEVEKGDTINYKVHQKVNNLGVDILERYTKFEIADPLDSNVDYVSSKVTDAKGNELTDFGTITYDKSTHKVTATASSEYLKKMTLSGEAYILETKTTVKQSVKNKTVIKNVGNVSINNQNEPTNEVKNTVLVPEIIDPTKKETNNKGINYDGKDVYAGDTLVFDVSQQVNELGVDLKNPYSSFGLYDILDKRLEYVSASILKDGKEMKDAKDLSFDKEQNRVSFTADKDFLTSMTYKKETYTLRITTKVSTNIAEGETINNKAESLINDSKRETNETTNPVKVPKGSVVINKVTNQLTGIAISFNNKEENQSNELTYEKLPQGGVTYELVAKEDITYGNGEVIAEKGTSFGKQTTDNKKGQARFNDLNEGEYQAIEKSAPLGIQVDPNPIDIEVRSTKKEQSFTVEQGHEDPVQEVSLSGTKKFEQVDGSFKAEAGATFGLYYTDDYVAGSTQEVTDTTETTTTNEPPTDSTNITKESNESSSETESKESSNSTTQETGTTTTTSGEKESTDKTIKAGTLVAEIEVNKDGSLSYKGQLVPNQRYTVKEIKTKDTHQLLKDELTFIYQPTTNNTTASIALYAKGYVTEGVYIPYDDVKNLKMPTKEVLSQSGHYKEPTEEQKAPIQNILNTENSIKKQILKEDGSIVDRYDILKNNELVTFIGTIQLGNNHSEDEPIIVEDNLPQGLSYQSMKLLDTNKKEITDQATLKKDGQKITLTLNKDYAKTAKSTVLYWEVKTKYTQSADVAGKELTNEMILRVGDKEYKGTANVTTPKLSTLPYTGEVIKNYALIGLLIILAVLFISFRANKKEKEDQQS